MEHVVTIPQPKAGRVDGLVIRVGDGEEWTRSNSVCGFGRKSICCNFQDFSDFRF